MFVDARNEHAKVPTQLQAPSTVTTYFLQWMKGKFGNFKDQHLWVKEDR
jgi:hypothetical protein